MKTCQDCGTNCVERGKRLLGRCPNFTRKGTDPMPIYVDEMEDSQSASFTLFNGVSVCSLCLLNDICSMASDTRREPCNKKIPVKAKVAESTYPCDYCIYKEENHGNYTCHECLSCYRFTNFCGVKAFIL